jgi:asparagine synthase (glutamine-hydrolysing)
MSGFAVVYGAPRAADVDVMLGKIWHRGPYLSGTHGGRHAMIGQNYLHADCPDVDDTDVALPVGNGRPDLRIGYDGQIGNARELANTLGLPTGPFLEERVVLGLRERHGNKMPELLDDAIFSFALVDGDKLFAARDVLGIKTLFFAEHKGALLLASELKSLAAVTDEVHEFPAGHFMDETGRLTRFGAIPSEAPEPLDCDVSEMTKQVVDIIERNVRKRVDFRRPTACLLSGGMDSSVITHLAARLLREQQGDKARIRTFAIGTKDSGDLASARLMAAQVNADHTELVVDLEQALAVLPEVIYHLESFDPSLVRSTVSNYLISRHASRQGVEVLLSGEGGDELFCGYLYLKSTPPEELFAKQMECMSYLHNNASLRLDRANLANSVRVVAPLICGELYRYALRIPPDCKQRPTNGQKVEKWIFRRAFEGVLPEAITSRLKQEFSQGSGLATLLPAYFEDRIGDDDLEQAQKAHPFLRSKEELHYFRLFREHYPSESAARTVGQWPYL